ncbi:MAG: hypothetical protein AXW14_03760 [Alteromonas sp. Nap_26]|nr:MAG: hypothetical protein AXW14_03760 [Alteromonas sp. Nap_26]
MPLGLFIFELQAAKTYSCRSAVIGAQRATLAAFPPTVIHAISTDEEIIGKVFVPFFTTKRDGTGVGLALTQQIMIAHGGQVKVCNTEQGGACFSLIF